MDYQIGDEVISLVSAGEGISVGRTYMVINVDLGERCVQVKGDTPQNFWLNYHSVELANKDSVEVNLCARGFGCDITLSKKVPKEVLSQLIEAFL